jgi:hypothetical protein
VSLLGVGAGLTDGGVGHQIVRPDEADMHLAGNSARIVIEVAARREIAAALGDLEVSQHQDLAARGKLGRHLEYPTFSQPVIVLNAL